MPPDPILTSVLSVQVSVSVTQPTQTHSRSHILSASSISANALIHADGSTVVTCLTITSTLMGVPPVVPANPQTRKPARQRWPRHPCQLSNIKLVLGLSKPKRPSLDCHLASWHGPIILFGHSPQNLPMHALIPYSAPVATVSAFSTAGSVCLPRRVSQHGQHRTALAT
jgi:hypothetical protein